MGKFTSETAREAGKKGKRGENKIVSLIRSVADTQTAVEVFKKLEGMAKEGDMDAIRLYLSYVVGKPKESVDITTDGDKITGFTVEVVRNAAKNSD